MKDEKRVTSFYIFFPSSLCVSAVLRAKCHNSIVLILVLSVKLSAGVDMNRIVLAVLVLLQLACLPIELSAQSQSEAAKSGGSTVSGTVIAKGIPFRNATVLLQAEQPAGSQARTPLIQGQTDDNGVYKI